MQAIDSTQIQTTLGTLTLAYEGKAGSKVWTWRTATGDVVATQPNVTAMMKFRIAHKVV